MSTPTPTPTTTASTIAPNTENIGSDGNATVPNKNNHGDNPADMAFFHKMMLSFVMNNQELFRQHVESNRVRAESDDTIVSRMQIDSARQDSETTGIPSGHDTTEFDMDLVVAAATAVIDHLNSKTDKNQDVHPRTITTLAQNDDVDDVHDRMPPLKKIRSFRINKRIPTDFPSSLRRYRSLDASRVRADSNESTRSSRSTASSDRASRRNYVAKYADNRDGDKDTAGAAAASDDETNDKDDIDVDAHADTHVCADTDRSTERLIEELHQEIDELDDEVEYMDGLLRKYKAKNADLSDQIRNKTFYTIELEERYADLKVEIARVRANEDNLTIRTNEAIAERDLQILAFSSDIAELRRERKALLTELKRAASRLAAADKKQKKTESQLSDTICERDSLKYSLGIARKVLRTQDVDVDTENSSTGSSSDEFDKKTTTKSATTTTGGLRRWRFVGRLPQRRRKYDTEPTVKPNEIETV